MKITRKFSFHHIIALFIFLTVCLQAASNPDNSLSPKYSPQTPIDRVIIKFNENLQVRFDNGVINSGKSDLAQITQTIFNITAAPLQPLFIRDQEEIEQERIELQTEKSINLPDLNSYYSIAVSDYETAITLLENLSGNPLIEKAYIRPQSYLAEDIPPTTPDFIDEQGYLEAAPGGVDAFYAWNVPGGNGENVQIIDIEGNWDFEHEDFGDNIGTLLYGTYVNYLGWASHGTAIIGMMGADSNGYGVTGIAHKAQINTVSIGTVGVAAAVDYAGAHLNPGDVITIPLNVPGPRFDFSWQGDQAGYVAEEYFDDVFDATQIASAKGIVVVTAAGNGQEDLDDPIYEDRFNVNYRNSRAIFAGAGAPPSGNWGTDRSRISSSNYGSRLNLQGWGKEVVTTGYGGLFNPDNDYLQHYTDIFSGTSAATGMIGGVVASLQSAYIEAHGEPMIIEDLVYLLDLSGTLQPNPNEKIGPRPDLGLALQAMQSPSGVSTNPRIINAVIPDGQISTTEIYLINKNTFSINFDITANDTMEGWSEGGWLSTTPSGGLVPAQDSILIDVNYDAGLLAGTTHPYKAGLIIDYSSAKSYDSLFVPIFLTVVCNDTSYSIYDTDNNGLPYQWIDITSLGTEIPVIDYVNTVNPFYNLDDGTAGPYPIGFGFNYFGHYFNNFYASTNGVISLTEDDITMDGYFDDMLFPQLYFSTLIAPFWNDLTLDPGNNGHGSIYYYTSPALDTFIVSFEKIGNLVPADDTLITFQIILTDEGKIRFQYKETGIGGAETTALVGISYGYDCEYKEYYNQFQTLTNQPHDNLAVEFRPNFETTYQIGDANADGKVNISDAVYIINYVFSGGPTPMPLESAEVNCDGKVNVSDAVYLINYVFQGGNDPGDPNGDGLPDC